MNHNSTSTLITSNSKSNNKQQRREQHRNNGGVDSGGEGGRMGFDTEESPLLLSALELTSDDLDFDTGKVDLLSTTSSSYTTTTPAQQQQTSSAKEEEEAKATVAQTCTNIVKTCMGTGTLALPFAASQGGLLFNFFGLAFFAYWNYYAVDALVKCLDLLPKPIDHNDDHNDNNDKKRLLSGGSERCTRHRRTRSSMQRLFHSMTNKPIVLHNPQPTTPTNASQQSSSFPSATQTQQQQQQQQQDDNNNQSIPPPPPPPTLTPINNAQPQKSHTVLLDDYVNDDEYYESILHNEPPEGTATYGKVAWYALGPVGFQLVDLAMLIFLMGVLIAFQVFIISMVSHTPFNTNSKALNSIWTIFVIAPISSVPSFKHLTKFSAMGIFAIFFTFIIVTYYGIQQNGSILNGLSEISWSKHMWPQSITAASNWFGVMAFGYGVAPITYNIQQSMKEPHLMTKATQNALLLVLIVYIIISDGIRILFLPTVPNFDGDVLQYLPNTWIPVSVRLAMIFVICMTAPVLVIPCGELVEGKLGIDSQNNVYQRIVVRFGICMACTVISIYVPGFVYVVSFVGSFCISLLGFVFPPLFHLILLKQRLKESSLDLPSGSAQLFKSERELMKVEDERVGLPSSEEERRRVVFLDMVLLIWGVVATMVTTYLTFASLLEQTNGGDGGNDGNAGGASR